MFSSASSSLSVSQYIFFHFSHPARESWDSAAILHIKALFHSNGKESGWHSLEKHGCTKWNFEKWQFPKLRPPWHDTGSHGLAALRHSLKITRSFWKGEKGNPYCTHIPTLRAQPSLPLRLCIGMSRTAPSANVAWNWRCRGTSEGLVFIAFVLFCCYFCFFSPPQKTARYRALEH